MKFSLCRINGITVVTEREEKEGKKMKSVGQASSNLSLGGVISSSYCWMSIFSNLTSVTLKEQISTLISITLKEHVCLFCQLSFLLWSCLTHSFNKGGEVKSEWRRNRTKGIVYVVEGDWVIGKERNDFRLRGVREMWSIKQFWE